MTTVEDVFDEVMARLEANTPITWYQWTVPDNEDIGTGAYGVAAVLGPYEVNTGRGIIGAEEDPMQGTILLEVVAPTHTAVKAQSKKATELLRGFEPTNTSELITIPARGYEPVTSKFGPTLISRNINFSFITNLNRI